MTRSSRILILSNGCFSDTDSNGRTLAKLFSGIAPEQLAQFFTYGRPDETVCANYYRVTDREALNSLIKFRPFGGVYKRKAPVPTDTQRAVAVSDKPHVRKTPLTMLLRELAWKLGRWKKGELNRWIDDFHPTCVFVCMSDNGFLADLAVAISRRCRIPVIFYTTEDYCLKNYNYMTGKKSFWYFLFHKRLEHAYRRLAPHVSQGIFNTELLKEDYEKKFHFPGRVVYPRSDVSFRENSRLPEQDSDLVVSYLGNLGLNRHRALMQVADCMAEIVPGVKLDIYGRICEAAKMDLLSNPNVRYMGVVSYAEVVEIMHKSNLLVHAEYRSPYHNQDLRHAFSTKIADSVCCGTPFLIYADESLAETQFLRKYGCAYVAGTAEELPGVLRKALRDQQSREKIIEQARKVSREIFSKVVDSECEM